MIRHSRHHNERAFTLVELMVAMAFVSMLLLAIAFVVIRISGIYNKGVTIKAVNQAGRIIVDDMKRTMAESDPGSINDSLLDQGRLCTGTYSYIWNIGESDSPLNKYRNDNPTASTKKIRLVKARDNGGVYCDAQNGLADIIPADATELLTSRDSTSNTVFDTNLIVQRLEFVPLTNSQSSGSALYGVSILLSNADQDVIDTVAGNCKPPKDAGSNNDYCAVNEFNFTVRPGSKGGQ